MAEEKSRVCFLICIYKMPVGNQEMLYGSLHGTWWEIRPKGCCPKGPQRRCRAGQLIGSCVWRYALHSQQRFPPPPAPLTPPFPWRMQSIFNDFIDLTIGLQRAVFIAETFRPRQHFNTHKSTFGTTLIDCKTAYICRKICFATVCLC